MFAREQYVMATRKAHRCDACLQPIPAMSPAIRWAGMTDGEFASCIYHTDCREAEIALNDLRGSYADEWQSLADMEFEDMPWLAEAFPTVAARLPPPPSAETET
jgi:hypothetical protein